MISSLVYILLFLTYILISLSENLSLSFKLTNLITKGLMALLIGDYLAETYLDLDWFGTPLVYILLYADCLIHHRYASSKLSKKNRSDYLPLLNFSFLVLAFEQISTQNFSFFIVGSLILNFVISRRRVLKSVHWSGFVPLVLISLMTLFYQFNTGLSWSIGIPLLVYFLMGSRLPIILKSEVKYPFDYPLIARVILIGILNTEIGIIGSKEIWLISLVIMMSLFILQIVLSHSEEIRWTLFNRGIEIAYLGMLVLFGFESRELGHLNIFILLSIVTFVGLTKEIRFKKVLTIVNSAALAFLSGFIIGPFHDFLSSMSSGTLYYGETNLSKIVYLSLVLLCLCYFFMNGVKRTFSRA